MDLDRAHAMLGQKHIEGCQPLCHDGKHFLPCPTAQEISDAMDVPDPFDAEAAHDRYGDL